MRQKLTVLGVCAMLAGCGVIGAPTANNQAVAVDTSEGQTRPVSRPTSANATIPVPVETARTVEDFDTTTTAEREAAASTESASGEVLLGETIVSLGDPVRPGFWIETPLASSPGSGRVVFADNGQSSQVELIPIDGPPTAGSRMSLAAMRVIGAPLAGLVEVQVFSGG